MYETYGQTLDRKFIGITFQNVKSNLLGNLIFFFTHHSAHVIAAHVQRHSLPIFGNQGVWVNLGAGRASIERGAVSGAVLQCTTTAQSFAAHSADLETRIRIAQILSWIIHPFTMVEVAFFLLFDVSMMNGQITVLGHKGF